MKKAILICIFMFLTALTASARRTNDVNFKTFEFEAGVGLTMGTKSVYDASEPGLQFYIEGRTNLKDTPWDVGLQISMGVISRRYEAHSFSAVNKLSSLTFVDYNFRHWKGVAPFVGFGFGLSMLDLDSPYYIENNVLRSARSHSSAMAFNPRVGVEFFNHLRLTVEYKAFLIRVSDPGGNLNNYFSVNLGFAFGGGPRR